MTPFSMRRSPAMNTLALDRALRELHENIVQRLDQFDARLGALGTAGPAADGPGLELKLLTEEVAELKEDIRALRTAVDRCTARLDGLVPPSPPTHHRKG